MYVASQNAILKIWTELQVSGESLDKYLSSFFDDVLSKWHEEVSYELSHRWCGVCFVGVGVWCDSDSVQRLLQCVTLQSC